MWEGWLCSMGQTGKHRRCVKILRIKEGAQLILDATLLLPQPPKITPTFTADVEFGVLTKDGDCILTGICRVAESLPPLGKRCCRFAPALFCAAEGGQVQCFFPKGLMRPCVRAAFFDGDDFVVPLPVLLPAFVAEGLGLGLGATIMPGLYPIVREPEGYTLCFLLNRHATGPTCRKAWRYVHLCHCFAHHLLPLNLCPPNSLTPLPS